MAALRRTDIDIAKGLAILLVVFGHLVARADPAGVTWYEPLRRAVYTFHMPFFLYLSGMAAVFSGAIFVPPAAWTGLVKSRAQRLLIPFFGLGFIIVLGKLLAAHLMFVDNQPAALGAGISELFWHTANSPALSIWYLFVLFVLTTLAPLLLRGRPHRLPLLLIPCLLLYCLPLPAYLYLDHIGRYAIFFALGACTAAQGERWIALIDRFWRLTFTLFLSLLTIVACYGAPWPPWATLLPIGALSMPALHGLVRNFRPIDARIFLFLGRYSFMIYLFNTLFIGLTKGLLLHVTSWNAPHFLPFAAALMTAGTLGPIVLKRTAFRHAAKLDRLTN